MLLATLANFKLLQIILAFAHDCFVAFWEKLLNSTPFQNPGWVVSAWKTHKYRDIQKNIGSDNCGSTILYRGQTYKHVNEHTDGKPNIWTENLWTCYPVLGTTGGWRITNFDPSREGRWVDMAWGICINLCMIKSPGPSYICPASKMWKVVIFHKCGFHTSILFQKNCKLRWIVSLPN